MIIYLLFNIFSFIATCKSSSEVLTTQWLSNNTNAIAILICFASSTSSLLGTILQCLPFALMIMRTSSISEISKVSSAVLFIVMILSKVQKAVLWYIFHHFHFSSFSIHLLLYLSNRFHRSFQ